jgi:mannose-1-phosphate guanylyltransferase
VSGPHSAFLLAAGLGTRLRPLTASRPKALLPVCGVPMLDYALALARRHGHREIIVNAHHHWQQIAAWASQRDVEIQVELPDVLGTGGGLRAALPRLADVVTIVNADILSSHDLSALAEVVPPGGAAMILREAPDAASIGPVERDAHGNVVRITSVVASAQGIPGTHFTGIHAMHRDAISRIPEGFGGVIESAYKELVPIGKVRALLEPGATWFDVGTPAAYLAANLAVLRGEIALPLDPWARGTRSHASWIGEGATIRGGIESCVVGPGVTVPEAATLRRCVVWEGATVAPGAAYEDSILFERSVLETRRPSS